jgi:hypothetical protein
VAKRNTPYIQARNKIYSPNRDTEVLMTVISKEIIIKLQGNFARAQFALKYYGNVGSGKLHQQKSKEHKKIREGFFC